MSLDILREIAIASSNGVTSLPALGMLTGDAALIGILPSERCLSCLATIATHGNADIDRDGELNVLDFAPFQPAWQGQEPIADCDADGGWSVLDFVCFRAAYMGDCE